MLPSQSVEQNIRLGIATILAVLLHLSTFIVFKLFPAQLEETTRTLKVSISKVSQPTGSSAEQANATQQNDDYILTNGLNNFGYERQTTNEHQWFSDDFNLPKQNLITDQILPNVINKQQASTSFNSLFSSETENERTLPIKSTLEAEPLSEYQLILLEHMLEARRYDMFHQHLVSRRISKAAYTLQLTLFPNGQIKKAELTQSSGDLRLDQLALQVAYNASPYPKPPRDEKAENPQYLVPINYRTLD